MKSIPFTVAKIPGKPEYGYEIITEEKKEEFVGLFSGGQIPGNQVLIAFYLGERPTAGYGINPSGLSLEGGRLIFRYREKRPAPGEVVGQVLSYPGILLTVDQKFLPGDFQVVMEDEDRC